eukprot:1044910-Rhodomonas_salina.1
MSLRACYAMPGTELACAGTELAYAATRCPVLSERTVGYSASVFGVLRERIVGGAGGAGGEGCRSAQGA